MVRNLIAGAAVAALFSSVAVAQTAAPVTSAPTPAAATSQQTLAQGEILISNLMGATVYVPKAGAATNVAQSPTAGVAAERAPNATLYLVNYRSVTKSDWGTMKNRYETVGEINDIVIGQDGKIRHAVVGVGGFLGIGEKNVALDLREFDMMRDEDGTLHIVANKTRANLEGLPTFKTARAS